MILFTYNDGSQAWLTEEEAEQAHRDEVLRRIDVCKAELAALDYKTIKYTQGYLSDDEWQETRQQCKALRDEIAELEAGIIN